VETTKKSPFREGKKALHEHQIEINEPYEALKRGSGRGNVMEEGQAPLQRKAKHRHIGPTTRAMAKRLDEDWDTATDGRETYLYMFQEVQNQA